METTVAMAVGTATVSQAFLMIITGILCTISIFIMSYGIWLLFQRWDIANYKIAYLNLKEKVIFSTCNKKNFEAIELEFEEIKQMGIYQSKVTELYNLFLSRFDKVNKYKKTTFIKPDRDVFKIRLQNRIDVFMKELTELVEKENTVIKTDRKQYLIYRDDERLVNEKLAELRNILNIK